MPDLDELKEFNECHLCKNVLCRPVFLTKCGHSPWCQQCVSVISPKPKQCPVCGEQVKGAPAKWPINRALGAVLRYLYADDYANRPNDDQLKYELDRQGAVDRLKRALQDNKDRGLSQSTLKTDYEEQALKLIQLAYPANEITPKTEVLQWCQCGFVCLPKFARKSGRWFWGCPGWSVYSRKRKRADQEGDADKTTSEDGPTHCGTFKWLSAAMKDLISSNTDVMSNTPQSRPICKAFKSRPQPDCNACNGTGVAYLSDGVYAACMVCGDINDVLSKDQQAYADSMSY